jgi:hypothetical protein
LVFHHQPRRVLAAEQRTGDVDVHGALKLLQLEIQKSCHRGYTGRVHQYVAAARELFNVCKPGRNRCRLTDIHGDGVGLVTKSHQCCNGEVSRLPVAVGDDDPVTRCRQMLRRCAAYAHGPAGDHGDTNCV